jgi:adenylate kinase family enzyme
MAFTMLGPRVVIIGNSGSGKTTLARQLECRVGGRRTDLDHIHWLDQVGTKRDEEDARSRVIALAAEENWIIEGVFGWLAEVALPRASMLIWLDMSPQVCRNSIATRGPWRDATAEQHAGLLAWAAAYWHRTTSSSFAGHQALFANFPRAKIRLSDRAEVDDLVAEQATT